MKKATTVNENIKALFDCFDDSMIQSCFEGIYGELWCDDENEPKTAVIVSGDFHYLAGEPAYADEIIEFTREKPNAVFVPSCDSWFEELDRACGGKLKKVQRYHMHLGKAGFDREWLGRLPDKLKEPQYKGYELCPIGREEYEQCLASDWAYSFVSNFSDYNRFREHGFGFVIKQGGKVVSGTSTYCYYSKGVEVEVSTAPDHRRKGLARISAARFIIHCLDRNLAPNWDARNMASVHIAQKLGFELHDTYTAYEFKPVFSELVLPNDKYDIETVEKLEMLDDEQLEPVIPQLLEWIQDMNWVIAPLVCDLLAQHCCIVESHLYELLKPENRDDIWKYNIIKYLLGMWQSLPEDSRIIREIERIAKNPTDGEKREFVDEAASKFLEAFA